MNYCEINYFNQDRSKIYAFKKYQRTFDARFFFNRISKYKIKITVYYLILKLYYVS